MKASCPSGWVEMIFLSLTPIDMHLPFSEIACCQPSTVNTWAPSASARLWCPQEQRLCQPHLCIPAQSGWMFGTRVSLVVLSVKDHLLLKVYKILLPRQSQVRSTEEVQLGAGLLGPWGGLYTRKWPCSLPKLPAVWKERRHGPDTPPSDPTGHTSGIQWTPGHVHHFWLRAESELTAWCPCLPVSGVELPLPCPNPTSHPAIHPATLNVYFRGAK